MQNTDDIINVRRSRKDSQPMAGQMLGKYSIVRELGRGGMGSVYLVYDTSLKRHAAVKIVRSPYDPASEEHERLLDRFKREAEASARISHPNVVKILDFSEVSGQHVQIMECVDGRTLRQEIDGDKAISPEDVVRIAIDLLSGLAAIHQAGLVHRDIKPQNVMLTSDGDEVKLLDLGLVKFMEKDMHDPTLTQAGMAMGSPTYMAPEQIGAKLIDCRADLYAVGVVLFQLLTGRAPFVGTQIEVFEQHRHKPMPRVVSPFGKLPKGLEAVIHKATEKDPDRRYQTADEMRRALEAIRFKSRHMLLNVALGVLVVAAALVVGTGISKRLEGDRRETSVTSVAEGSAHKTTTEQPVDDVEVAPLPPVVVKTSVGCAAFESGESSQAVEILGKILARAPNDASALYCLCGAEARMPDKAAAARKHCQAYLDSPDREKGKATMVRMWLKRL